MAEKLPALQFYPADWRKDPGVQSLDFAVRMVWFEILLIMHESPRRGVLLLPNGKPMTTPELSRNIGMPAKQLAKALALIDAAGVCGWEDGTGALVNRRMVRDESIRAARTAAGHLGGNPNLVKQKPTNTPTKTEPTDEKDDKQKTTPSSSSSDKNPIVPSGTDPAYSPEFEIFWTAYPKKTGKGAAWKAWARARPTQPVQSLILEAIAFQRNSIQWRDSNGKYIPNPATWLNERRWEDETPSNGASTRPKSVVL